jgi:hypothetical protein
MYPLDRERKTFRRRRAGNVHLIEPNPLRAARVGFAFRQNTLGREISVA